MGGKVFLGVLTAAVVAVVSIVLGRLSPGSGREAGNSMPTWVLDDHLQSFHKSRVFEPAPGTPPTTPESAVQAAIRTLGGVGNISGNVRVGYVLVTTRWPELKDKPMWVVQVDQIMWSYPKERGLKWKLSRAEVLIDADTGKVYSHSEDELPSNGTGTPTPVPSQDTPTP